MKKIIIFLITILALLPKVINASPKDFYEGEYIDNIWINKVTPDRKTIYYQKARTFREYGTDRLAYCIEPFSMFNETSSYQATLTPNNLNDEQKEKIALIAYLGYNCKNHEDKIWYAITQLLIWQTADPTGDYYFTDSLNGNRINTYQGLIDELNETVEKYRDNSGVEKSYSIVSGEKIEIYDPFQYKTDYYTNNEYVKIEKDKITIENLPVGEHEIAIMKDERYYDTPIIFFQSTNSQNLMTLGNPFSRQIIITVRVQNTSIKITKLDSDTNSTTPSGEAKLEGAKYQIYDRNMKEICQLEIDETKNASIKNLPYGKYYLKEIDAGEGYEIDQNIYEFELEDRIPEINLNLKNKVIKGALKINKVYIKNDEEFNEANITFNIYNKNNQLIDQITTDEFGNAEILLPYGIYKIEQANTIEGYQYIEPFTIIIKNQDTLTYNLKNYEIEVPNTYTTTKNTLKNILQFFLKLIGQIYDNKIININYYNNESI